MNTIKATNNNNGVEKINNSKDVIIVDSLMGSGKTSWAINYMKKDKSKKFIYITPYLSEVERIKENCKERKFCDPMNYGNGKLDSFNKLLFQGKDIVSTHALFKMSTEETRQLIQSNGYTLILDEVMDVLQEIKLEKDDLPSMLELNLIKVNKNGSIIWNEDKLDYQGKYNDVKLMCKNKSLFLVNNCLFMWTFPISIFNSFFEVYVLTYLFNGQIQRYYYDLYNINYKYRSVLKHEEEYALGDYIEKYDMSKIKKLINISDDDKLNVIGEELYALSKSWFTKNSLLVKQLQKNTYNYFTNKTKTKARDNMWVTFKTNRTNITGKGYAKGFVSLGTRATNDYVNKHSMAYCANIFLNPMIEHFFNQHNVKIDENTYALSELIQWVWRGRIRKGESISIYIPAKRMRNLLIEWLEQ